MIISVGHVSCDEVSARGRHVIIINNMIILCWSLF